MIAAESVRAFDDLIVALPGLVPPGVVPDPDAPLAALPVTLLSPGALPPDPDAAAIVAVIDHAIPFAHPLLCTAEGLSRVASVWVQDAPARRRRVDLPFGDEWTGAEIDALRAGPGGADPDAPYRAAGLIDAARPGGAVFLRDTSHGAAVATLAAGFDPQGADGVRGRRHPVIAVSLPDIAVADSAGTMTPFFLQAAVVYVIARARVLARQMSHAAGRAVRPPVVINLSMGITAGSPDGRSAMERLHDAIASIPEPELGPVAVVLAAGNSRLDRLHGRIAPGERLGWALPPADPTPSALELCPEAAGAGLTLHLTAPDGESGRLHIAAGQAGLWRLTDAAGRVRLNVASRPAADGRCVVTLIAAPTAPARPGAAAALPGLWQVALAPDSPAACGVDIQRDDALPGLPGGGRQSRLVDLDAAFAPDRDPAGRPLADDPPGARLRMRGTVNRYAGGQMQIRAGAAMGGGGRLAASPYSSRLADGAPGDVLALADRDGARPGIVVPGMRGAVRQVLSGTSLAAPQVTRWLAARLAEDALPGARRLDRAAVVALARAEGVSLDGVPVLGLGLGLGLGTAGDVPRRS